MSKEDVPGKRPQKQFDEDMMSMGVVSSTEVTGMVPTPPLDESEVEGYLNLFPVRQQVGKAAKKADTPEEQKKRSDGRKE